MTRRLTNPTTYNVKTDRARYAVTLERIKNDINGAPRFRASVIVLRVFEDLPEEEPSGFYTTAWTFTGHYMRDEDEARFIVERYEAGLQD